MYCNQIQTKNGEKRWVCVKDGPPDPVTGKRTQIKRRGKTKKEAEHRVRDAIAILEDKGILAKTRNLKTTFDKVAFEWLEIYAETTQNKRSTIRIREKEINILNRFMAKANIAQISYRHYQRLLNELTKDYARNTVSGVHTTAGMIFKYAKKEGYIKDNPAADAVVPKKRKTIEEIENNPIEEKYLELEELDEFLTVVQHHGLDLDLERFYLLAFSGMRPGELCALKEPDFNFKTNEIRITKTLYNETNNMRKYELTPPKTEGSIRTIPIEAVIIELIKKHIRRQNKMKMRYRHLIEDFHDEKFIFCRSNGYPFAPKNILVRMERILEKTSITKHATPHIFRHTHISMLTEAGVDITEIMKRVGHDDMKTTLNIYTHVTNKMKEETSRKVHQTYSDILNFKVFS